MGKDEIISKCCKKLREYLKENLCDGFNLYRHDVEVVIDYKNVKHDKAFIVGIDYT